MISLAGFSKENGFSPLLESVICAFSAGRLVYTLGYMSDTSFILELQFSCISFIFYVGTVDATSNYGYKPPRWLLFFPSPHFTNTRRGAIKKEKIQEIHCIGMEFLFQNNSKKRGLQAVICSFTSIKAEFLLNSGQMNLD